MSWLKTVMVADFLPEDACGAECMGMQLQVKNLSVSERSICAKVDVCIFPTQYAIARWHSVACVCPRRFATFVGQKAAECRSIQVHQGPQATAVLAT